MERLETMPQSPSLALQPDAPSLRGAAISASELAMLSRELYSRGPLLTRKLQHWRPYICPFDKVIDEIPLGSSVLDIGCGGGLLLGALVRLERIRRGVGFDYSFRAIRVATEVAEALDGKRPLDFHHLSVADEWPRGDFDVVTMIDVLHHVPRNEQEAVFRTAARTVKPGARLVYKDISPRPRWRAFANTLHDLIMAQQWVHYVPMKTIVEWAAAEGLQCAHTFDYHRLWYGHHFAVFIRSR